jgi:hypothetical protein
MATNLESQQNYMKTQIARIECSRLVKRINKKHLTGEDRGLYKTGSQKQIQEYIDVAYRRVVRAAKANGSDQLGRLINIMVSADIGMPSKKAVKAAVKRDSEKSSCVAM